MTRRGRNYAVHVLALLLAIVCFAGTFWLPQILGLLTGALFCVAGGTAIAAQRSLLTFRGGTIARSLLADRPERAAQFERLNAWVLGASTFAFGVALIVWTLALRAELGH